MEEITTIGCPKCETGSFTIQWDSYGWDIQDCVDFVDEYSFISTTCKCILSDVEKDNLCRMAHDKILISWERDNPVPENESVQIIELPTGEWE